MGESAALKERENMNCRIAEGMVKKKFHRAIAAVAVCVLIAALVVFLVFVILELKEGI